MHRRSFIRAGALGAAALAVPRVVWPGTIDAFDTAPAAGDPLLRQLAAVALDAARAAGATYADVRFTRTRNESLGFNALTIGAPSQTESLAIGVRVIVEDAWGFVSGPDWTPDGVAALARAAVVQARATSWESRPPIALAPAPVVSDGVWTTPIKRDPFDVPLKEKAALMLAVHDAALKQPSVIDVTSRLNWVRQDKTFASSEGSFISQTLHTALGGPAMFTIVVTNEDDSKRARSTSDLFEPTGAGYELLTEAKLETQLPALVEAGRLSLVDMVPPEVGRYDVAVDARMMASIVDESLAPALELDRAMGYEANSVGSSFLAPPDKMLGQFRLAGDFVTVTANRTQARGAATVGWDDEGSRADSYTIVKNGLVDDYHTTRQQAEWLSDWYRQQHRETRSHAASECDSAFSPPIQLLPNIALEPAQSGTTFEEMVASIDDGVAFMRGRCSMDQQLSGGQGMAPRAYEVKKGKLGRPLRGASFFFRTADFWRNIVAIGGPGTSITTGVPSTKGEPSQRTEHSVTAVPAKVRNVDVFNLLRTL